MAGSYNHVTNDDGSYRGHALLDDMKDAVETIEEMWYIILQLSGGDPSQVKAASEDYYRRIRREEPWPPEMLAAARWHGHAPHTED